MEYYYRFGLEFNPFLKNSKEIICQTNEFTEVQARLNYLLTTKGFGLLTGNPGNGKTTAIRVWSKNLNPSKYKVVYSSLSTLTVLEFYRELALNLGLEPQYKKVDNFRMIQQEISRSALEKHVTPVIIIDEANHISNGILNDLKLIFNFEMDSRNRAILLLAGLPNLNYTLNLKIHEALRQRITMNYNLEGMTKEETKEYVKKKLAGANCTQQIFDENALEAIANASDGIPRMVDKYANACLLLADSQGTDRINSEIVMNAVNDCMLN